MDVKFQLTSDRGEIFTAIRFPGGRLTFTSLGSTQEEYVDGLPTYRLEDGTPLNDLGDGRFRNVRTGEVLARRAPS